MDLFIIFIFLLMIGFGIYRGFIREILGLFSLSIALFLSVICNKWIVNIIFDSTENHFVASIVVYCITFMFFVIILNIIVRYVLRILSTEPSSVMDRFFGGIIGFVKAYLFCFFIYFIIFSFSLVLKPDFDKKNEIENINEIIPDWLRDSKTYSVFYSSIVKLDFLIKKINNSRGIKSDENGVQNEIKESLNSNAIENKEVDKKDFENNKNDNDEIKK